MTAKFNRKEALYKMYIEMQFKQLFYYLIVLAAPFVAMVHGGVRRIVVAFTVDESHGKDFLVIILNTA